jgi:hypothetical protein
MGGSAKGMGGSAKGLGGAGGTAGGDAPVADTSATWISSEVLGGQAADCGAEVQERGHQPVLHGESAHTAYNKMVTT